MASFKSLSCRISDGIWFIALAARRGLDDASAVWKR